MSVPIKAWSFSSLDTFTTCARKYWAEQIAKIVPREETAAQAEGVRQHLAFEQRVRDKTPLPADLAQHEPLMREIEAYGGTVQCELKYGLNQRLEPVDFYAKDVWHRGIIDVRVRRPDGTGVVVDYKSGKPHNKARQLHLFSAYCFIEGDPKVTSFYYWTKTVSKTMIILPSGQLGPILQSVVPDLKEYKEAFKLDLWPPKRNFLCRNYCGVVDCEFHGKGMNDRI